MVGLRLSTFLGMCEIDFIVVIIVFFNPVRGGGSGYSPSCRVQGADSFTAPIAAYVQLGMGVSVSVLDPGAAIDA